MLKHMYKLGAIALLVGAGGIANAQTVVPVPDQSQTTTLIAQVGEQVRINVPATVTFVVANVANPTNATAAITLDNIVLSSATRQLNLLVRAEAAAFTPPVVGDPSWVAGDVSWAAGGWTNGAGAGGTLSTTFASVVLGTGNATSVSNPGMAMTLAANTAVNRSGSHTMVIRWRVEGVGL